jgi:hypothetical protein
VGSHFNQSLKTDSLFDELAWDILMWSDPNIYLFNGHCVCLIKVCIALQTFIKKYVQLAGSGTRMLLFSTKRSYSFKKEDGDRDCHAAGQYHDSRWKLSGEKIAISMLYEQSLYCSAYINKKKRIEPVYR